MKKTTASKTVFLFSVLCLAFLPLFSCATQINGVISANGSATLSVNTALQPRMTAMITALTSAAGQTDRTIIDGDAIAGSLRGAPGIASIILNNTSPSAVEGTIRISNINEFLASVDRNRFIVFEQAEHGGGCQININRENCSELLALLSPEINDYLNALMAPVVTDEDISKSDYLELITMFYNRAISDEIAGSQLYASIEFPGRITEVNGGTFSGSTNRADFIIPLLDILVLETPLTYEVSWN